MIMDYFLSIILDIIQTFKDSIPTFTGQGLLEFLGIVKTINMVFPLGTIGVILAIESSLQVSLYGMKSLKSIINLVRGSGA